MKRELKYIGCDSCDRPVYEDAEGTLFVDTDPRSHRPIQLCTKYNNKFDGEPDTPIQYTKYNQDTITVDHRETWR